MASVSATIQRYGAPAGDVARLSGSPYRAGAGAAATRSAARCRHVDRRCRRASASPSAAWPDMPGRCRCRCGTMRRPPRLKSCLAVERRCSRGADAGRHRRPACACRKAPSTSFPAFANCRSTSAPVTMRRATRRLPTYSPPSKRSPARRGVTAETIEVGRHRRRAVRAAMQSALGSSRCARRHRAFLSAERRRPRRRDVLPA